jgi:hypothetical protein
MNLLRICYCLMAFFLLGPGFSFSQEKPVHSNITGKVVSQSENMPVEGAVIVFTPSGTTTSTDEQGRFSIRLNEVPDSVIITGIGYEPRRLAYQAFKVQREQIALSEEFVELNSVRVALQPGEQYNYISKLDIKMRDITNSQEVLRLVPGLFIGQHAGGGKAEQIFLRGFDIDHGTDVNISVDGMPVNMVSHAHGQGYADLHFLIPELIERVSFKKGPYYADKGNMTTAGFVDFRTKNSLPSSLIKMEAGQFNTYRALGLVDILSDRMRQKEQHAYIATEYMYTKGYFDHPQNFNRVNVFGKYHGKLGDKHTLSLSASTFSSEWTASGQIPERALQNGLIGFFGAIDPNEGGNTGRSNINALLQTILRNGDVIRNQLFYTAYDFELYSNFTFFLNNNVDGDQIRQKEKRSLYGYNGSYTHTGYAGSSKFVTNIGWGVRYDRTRGSELSKTKERNILIDPVKLGDIKEMNAGIWVGETVQWTERFSMNAGLRFDYFDVTYQDRLAGNAVGKATAATLSPKLNFYYQLNDKTQLYLTTGKGFHSNDTRVVVEKSGREILPAAYGADLGIVLKPSKDLLIQAALWWLDLDQEFVYVGDEGVVEPSGKSRRIGVDLSMRFQPARWLYLDMDANYSNGRAIAEPKGQDRLPLAPVFTSIGGLTYKSRMGVNAGLRYRYMGDRPANEDNRVVAKGYFVTDAVVSLERKKFEIGFAIQNLFDVRWKETQFDTESQLQNEPLPVSEIHFTPGSPFFFRTHVSFFF